MGEDTSFSEWLDSFRVAAQENVLERNTLMTETFEQAAYDRMLFNTAGKGPGFELRTPEYVTQFVKTGHLAAGFPCFPEAGKDISRP